MARPIDDLDPDTGDGTYVPPSFQSADWANIATLAAGHTDYRSVNFGAQDSTVVNLNGTYGVLAVAAGAITLADPADVNASWSNITTATAYSSPSLSTQGERWIGPFILDMPDLTQVVCNFTAPQGMYRITKKGKNRPRSVSMQVEVTPIDDNDDPTGEAELFTATIYGDGTDKKPKGVTVYADVSFVGRCKVRCRRTTDADFGTSDTIVDEVQWRDCYGTAPTTMPHFGDVTTVHSRTYATAGAVSVKERKLNCRAVRRLLERNVDDTFGPTLTATRNAADIICNMAIDPYIGGRPTSELDVAQIYDTIDEVQTYFGIDDVGEFSYTFDQDDVSSEEMMQSVAQAVFCQAYRQGSLLRLFFEQQTEDSVLLFNHRNKAPGSENRTVRFGRLNDFDGVELDYISGDDGAKLTTYIPADRSAVKPRKLEITGVVDRRGDGAVPFLHASRAWNKIRYQHTTSEFTAMAEASQLVLTQRVEVADNTRSDTVDGEVRGQDGLVLELSQPFQPVDGVDYTIFLQLSDGTVEPIDCTAGPDDMSCTLSAPPSAALVVRDTAWALTTYQIVGSDNVRPSAFLITEKGAFEKHQVPVQVINYDDRYYQADGTYRA